MNSRFRQVTITTTLDFGLGWHTHRTVQARVAYERSLRAIGASEHQIALAMKGCTPENPCGMTGCVNTSRKKTVEKTAAN